MKTKTMAVILGGALAFFLFGSAIEGSASPYNVSVSNALVNNTLANSASSDTTSIDSVSVGSPEENSFSFADLRHSQFCFSSGVGAWATLMRIDASGGFSGEYHDSDMGSIGDGYPNGTVYLCHFTGQFTEPEQVNDYAWSVKISELSYEQPVDTEEIKDGILYAYSDAYGLYGADEILIYLPGTPLEELPEAYRGWVGYYDLSTAEDTELPYYGLYNVAQEEGFSSYDYVERMESLILSAEESGAALENFLQNDALTQAELNETAQELYNLWDGVLNTVWRSLKDTLDEETMSILTAEELEWISWKEAEAAAAGAAYEGGSMQSMAANQKAAELTKERTYELMRWFD